MNISERSKLWIIFISLIVLLNAAGIGYGSWQSNIKVENVLSTGNIKPVFSMCWVDKENDQDNLTDIQLSHDEKSMNITINNAYPGYSAVIKYRITNEGTIPVYCKASIKPTIKPDNPITLKIEEPADIIECKDYKDGTITITVKQDNNYKAKRNRVDGEQKYNYKYSINLIFNQYNMLDK